MTNQEGYFYGKSSDFEKYADPNEVRIEVEAQIKQAISLGIDPTHLDSHQGSVLGLSHGRDFVEVIFDLCEKYALPFCLPMGILEHPGFSFEQKQRFKLRIQSANRRGVLLIDNLAGLAYHLSSGENYEAAKKELMNQIYHLGPGITQITTHPAIVSDELKELTVHYEKREIEYHLFKDFDVREFMKSQNIFLTSWKKIRELQREGLS